jgi:hypothetical protein
VKSRTKCSDLLNGYPIELIRFAEYVKSCRNEETPRYQYCRKLLQQLITSAKPQIIEILGKKGKVASKSTVLSKRKKQLAI